MSVLTLESLRRMIAGLPPPLDELEIRFHDWDCMPKQHQSLLLKSGVALMVDEMIPPGIVLSRNITLQRNLTIHSSLQEMAACITIYDVRPQPKKP